MNNVFTAKLLQNLRNKKGEKGFTLIELLVVVIIIGVLAAVALPNLLGQVGKARESEAKSAMGALNRAQQGYHLEAREFYGEPATAISGDWLDTETALGVVPGKEFYDYGNATTADGDASGSLILAVATDPANDGTRDFAAGMTYTGGAFTSTLCIAQNKGTATATAPKDATAAAGATLRAEADIVLANATANTCIAGNEIE